MRCFHAEVEMRQKIGGRSPWLVVSVVAWTAIVGAVVLRAQAIHEAPAHAPSTGRLTPAGEPGTPLKRFWRCRQSRWQTNSRRVDLCPIRRMLRGIIGVKPASDNRNPRLKLFMRSDARGAWSFDTIRPGSYPNSRVPGHIHFEIGAQGDAPRVFEIVFEGDPFVTAQMRSDPAFSVWLIEGGGRVTERINVEIGHGA